MSAPLIIHPDHPFEFARSIFHQSQMLDPCGADGNHATGACVLAGAKVLRRHGYLDEYRWAFSLSDVIGSVLYLGPVVIGVPWYESMWATRPSGLVEVDGRRVGGHSLVLTGFSASRRLRGEGRIGPAFQWRNSWGRGYGKRGHGWVRAADLERLLDEGGEACVPFGRSRLQRAPVQS